MNEAAAVVVPTNLTPEAAVAYPFATRWASAFHHPIRLLYIDPMADIGRSRRAGLVHPAEAQLAQERARLAGSGATVTAVTRVGFPAFEILTDTERDTSLVVLSLTGKLGRYHRMLGSVAGKVLRTTPQDTLVVRMPMEDRPIQRILMPVDLSEMHTGAFESAVRIAKVFGASIEVLHVCPQAGVGLYPLENELGVLGRLPVVLHPFAAAEQQLLAYARYAAEAHVEFRTRLLSEADPAREILGVIEESDPDLVIMAGHGRHGFSRLLLGSVCEDVVQASVRPVLVLKAQRTSHEMSAAFGPV